MEALIVVLLFIGCCVLLWSTVKSFTLKPSKDEVEEGKEVQGVIKGFKTFFWITVIAFVLFSGMAVFGLR